MRNGFGSVDRLPVPPFITQEGAAIMLARRPSFSRQRKAPPPPGERLVRPPLAVDDAKSYAPAANDEGVILSKSLQGYLKKKHASSKAFGPKWG